MNDNGNRSASRFFRFPDEALRKGRQKSGVSSFDSARRPFPSFDLCADRGIGGLKRRLRGRPCGGASADADKREQGEQAYQVNDSAVIGHRNPADPATSDAKTEPLYNPSCVRIKRYEKEKSDPGRRPWRGDNLAAIYAHLLRNKKARDQAFDPHCRLRPRLPRHQSHPPGGSVVYPPERNDRGQCLLWLTRSGGETSGGAPPTRGVVLYRRLARGVAGRQPRSDPRRERRHESGRLFSRTGLRSRSRSVSSTRSRP